MQEGIGGGCYVAAWCRRGLLCSSRVREEGTGAGCYVAAGYKRRLLCGNRVQGEAAMWKQG